ncbi:MAG TPA: hypothetical protein VLK30_03085 [Candidatus Limnocylindrales bacterium]|nr:hypothetical protein [Candidatus Limnocylindrales bacterium]
MDEYRDTLVKWAQGIYSNPEIAAVAASEAWSGIQAGNLPGTAEIQAHRAAVKAGGEYRCRPDRVGKAIVVCVLIAALFVPATLMGLSVNPSLAGYAFVTVAGGLPFLGLIGLVMVRLNSCFFVTEGTVGRRNWVGRVAAKAPRSHLQYVSFKAGSWARVYGSWNREFEGPDDSKMSVIGTKASLSEVSLIWWSNGRIRQFIEVLGLPSR